MTAQLVTPDVHLNLHKFTTKQYQLMYETGIFTEGDRYLIHFEAIAFLP